MEQVTKLTVLQSEIGYKPGEVDIIAILGLFGEAGEILEQWMRSVAPKDNLADTYLTNKITDAIMSAIAAAKEIDQIKKEIRDKKIENPFEKYEDLSAEFDKEHADVFYYLNALCINRKTTVNKLAHTVFEKVISKSVEKGIISEQDGLAIHEGTKGFSFDQINDINKDIQSLPANKRGFVSDGYHTFNEIYDHRCVNFIAMCKLLCLGPHTPWVSRKDSEGKEMGEWFLLGIPAEEGQISYHIPMKFWTLCKFADYLDKAPAFDGHTSEDVLNRLIDFIR